MVTSLESSLSADQTDPSLIGSHCQLLYCNRLDFLPFKCESCHGIFCLDHRSETAHQCPKSGDWAARRRKDNVNTPSLGAGKPMREIERPCAVSTCRTIIGTSLSTSVHCMTCNRYYCLKHRMKEEHECSRLVPIRAHDKAHNGLLDYPAEQTKAAFSKLRAWGLGQKMTVSLTLPKPKRSTVAAAQLSAINNLKKTAKGDEKLPNEKRVYIHVEAEAATTSSKFPAGAFFYSKDWVIGRVLDAAAKSLQVQNVNNRGNEDNNKLRVYHVEGGRLLEYSEKVSNVLVNGNSIVLLRGVGPGVPDLIDLTPK